MKIISGYEIVFIISLCICYSSSKHISSNHIIAYCIFKLKFKMENTPEKQNCKLCNVLVEKKVLEEEMCSSCCLYIANRRKEVAKESAVERYYKQSQMLIILGVIGKIRETNEKTTFI